MTTPQAAPARATYREVFAVGQFRVLFTGYTLFLGGETVKMLALSVTVYAGTGSPLLAALAYVAGFLPYALGGTLLLAYADRWPPRAVMVGYDLVRAAVAAVLAAGLLSPTAMLVLVFVTGIPSAVASAARSALLPELLDGDRYVLGRAVFSMAAGGTQVLGFAVGGMLIAALGPYGALWITVASCLLSAALLRLRLAERPRRGMAAGYAVRETWRVNRELLRQPAIRSLLLAQWLPPALVVGAEGVLVPYAVQIGMPDSAGLLFTAVALGMLTGDLAIGRLVTRNEGNGWPGRWHCCSARRCSASRSRPGRLSRRCCSPCPGSGSRTSWGWPGASWRRCRRRTEARPSGWR
ncbi:MFS transporter [Nonomuraea sp. NPDC046570]|uniref:MFS transporter n=1 Tax=Nonomuraea sp. NPDC046570 TaxID=3155255 RepID=UPI0033E5CD16